MESVYQRANLSTGQVESECEPTLDGQVEIRSCGAKTLAAAKAPRSTGYVEIFAAEMPWSVRGNPAWPRWTLAGSGETLAGPRFRVAGPDIG